MEAALLDVDFSSASRIGCTERLFDSDTTVAQVKVERAFFYRKIVAGVWRFQMLGQGVS